MNKTLYYIDDQTTSFEKLTDAKNRLKFNFASYAKEDLQALNGCYIVGVRNNVAYSYTPIKVSANGVVKFGKTALSKGGLNGVGMLL